MTLRKCIFVMALMNATSVHASCLGDPLTENAMLDRMNFPNYESTAVGEIALKLEVRTCYVVSGCGAWISDPSSLRKLGRIFTDVHGTEVTRVSTLKFTAWRDRAWISLVSAGYESSSVIPSPQGKDAVTIPDLWLLDDRAHFDISHRRGCIEVTATGKRLDPTPENNTRRYEARLTGSLRF